MFEKWQSVTHHVTNQHDWGTGIYTKCAHDAVSEEDVEATKWIEVESPAHEALNKMLFDKRLLEGIKKLNLFCHTGQLENFNNLLTQYAPKRIAFSYEGMVARAKLAALDHNHNAGRKQATVDVPKSTSAEEGSKRFILVYTKARGIWTAKPIYEGKDYSYLNDMMAEVLRRKLQGRKGSTHFCPPVLPANVAPAAIERPSKNEAISEHLSRYPSKPDEGGDLNTPDEGGDLN